MSRLEFNNEQELEIFVFKNLDKYFSKDRIFIGDKRKIKTKTGITTIPDGFLIDLENKKLCFIENELIKHGVFKHIVEQIIKFIIAFQNESSKKKLKQIIFDEIKKDKEKYIIIFKKCYPDIQEIEIFEKIDDIINSQPELYIFIDEINRDLEDFCLILKNSVEIKAIEVYKFKYEGSIVYAFNDEEVYFLSDEDKPIKESHASETYRNIFSDLIKKFKKVLPNSTKRGASTNSWLGISIGTTDFHVVWEFKGREPNKILRIGMYFESSNADVNYSVFKYFRAKEAEMAELFGETINYGERWLKSGDWSAIYISREIGTLQNFIDKKNLKQWALDNMVKLYKYYMQYSDEVKELINKEKK